METPFVYGRLATGENFTDRIDETAHLVNNFRSLINTIIISPRRWGKSSLVHRAAEQAVDVDSRLRICHIDLFNVRSEAEFYHLLAESVVKATANKWDEMRDIAKNFLARIVPKIVLSGDSTTEFSFEFDFNRVRDNVDEILDLAEKIAVDKGLKLVICIDEFQNIASFADPLFLQKLLRSHWQHHQHVSYCLYGSKRHMMLEVFTNSSWPFYKFGDLIFLNKIPQDYLVDFIRQRFADTDKNIVVDAATELVQLVDCHPYYVQQLAQLVWLRTMPGDTCGVSTVRSAHISLVEQMSLLFDTITETMTNGQLGYLQAIVCDESAPTSLASLRRYGLSSATAAYRAKKALIEADILDDSYGRVQFQDPVYAYWLKNIYFKK